MNMTSGEQYQYEISRCGWCSKWFYGLGSEEHVFRGSNMDSGGRPNWGETLTSCRNTSSFLTFTDV